MVDPNPTAPVTIGGIAFGSSAGPITANTPHPPRVPTVGDIWYIMDGGVKWEYELLDYDITYAGLWTTSTINPLNGQKQLCPLDTHSITSLLTFERSKFDFKVTFSYGDLPPAVDKKKYPHTCARCQEPAYVGFNSIDCSNKFCGQEVTITV